MRMISIAFAALALAACDPDAYAEEQAIVEQCRAAQTYGAAYGTPVDRGPCWGQLMAHAVGPFGIESFTVRRRGTANGIAVLTYQNNRLVSAATS